MFTTQEDVQGETSLAYIRYHGFQGNYGYHRYIYLNIKKALRKVPGNVTMFPFTAY